MRALAQPWWHRASKGCIGRWCGSDFHMFTCQNSDGVELARLKFRRSVQPRKHVLPVIPRLPKPKFRAGIHRYCLGENMNRRLRALLNVSVTNMLNTPLQQRGRDEVDDHMDPPIGAFGPRRMNSAPGNDAGRAGRQAPLTSASPATAALATK